jgi:DNA topoisomerase-1
MPSPRAAPRLIHVDDSLPGIRRERTASGWRYRDAAGKVIRDRAEIERLNAIALPPAYEDAWFCPAANGHILATGYDARGRKQYRYHPDFRAAREADKYDRCAAFGHALPRTRASARRRCAGVTRDWRGSASGSATVPRAARGAR